MPWRNKYVRLPTSILHDPKWGRLSAHEFMERIMAIVDDPAEWHYDVSPERIAWNKIRRKTIKLVFERDPHKCVYCGSTRKLQIDHIVPLSRGGSNNLDNLQILCKKCNCHKLAHTEE